MSRPAIVAAAVVGAAVFASPSGFAASSLDTFRLATDLGSVLASEEVCGLSYDQAAIVRFIEANVAADDMSFPSTLQMMTGGAERKVHDLSTSARTAHCAQITRIARSYGFID